MPQFKAVPRKEPISIRLEIVEWVPGTSVVRVVDEEGRFVANLISFSERGARTISFAEGALAANGIDTSWADWTENGALIIKEDLL